jgi:Predicted hydrolases or acyltransferases (alpha/beta hydrolase superfamily)
VIQDDTHVKKITLNDSMEIAYFDSGTMQKKFILFIHGLANYHKVWMWNIASLYPYARCIAMDLPGNGLSSRSNYDYTIDFYTETVIRFIEKMGFNQIIIAGHSMGGMIATKVALARPKLIKQVWLFAPAGFEYYSPSDALLFKSAIAIGNFINMDEIHIAQSIHSSFFEKTPIAEKIISELSQYIQQNDRVAYRRMLEKSIHSMLDTDLFNQLHLLNVPIHCFFGENDMLIPNRFLHPVSTQEIAQTAMKEIPHGQLYLYANTGHFVQIERQHEINPLLIELVEQIGS